MKKVITTIYIFGLLLSSFGFFVSLYKVIELNGLGNIFQYERPEIVNLNLERDSIDVKITYSYVVEKKEYYDSYEMVSSYYDRCDTDSLIVNYNKTFPSVSYIEGIPLKIRINNMGMVLSLIFFLFLFIVWNVSNRDKWFRTYKEVGNRPWLYPVDNNEKNALKRFKSRLFRKQ